MNMTKINNATPLQASQSSNKSQDVSAAKETPTRGEPAARLTISAVGSAANVASNSSRLGTWESEEAKLRSLMNFIRQDNCPMTFQMSPDRIEQLRREGIDIESMSENEVDNWISAQIRKQRAQFYAGTWRSEVSQPQQQIAEQLGMTLEQAKEMNSRVVEMFNELTERAAVGVFKIPVEVRDEIDNTVFDAMLKMLAQFREANL
ncbi:MAG: hypothetical protein FWB87_04380 [Defluviitaleaceae bacterium]|nr:hypothetical protein [Defluviitaleaceae bacterium]